MGFCSPWPLAVSLSLAAEPVCATSALGDGWTAVRCPRLLIEVRAIETFASDVPVAAVLARASAEKAAEDVRLYGALVRGAGHADLRAWAVAEGYYGSTYHLAWALAAEARTGGRVAATWWMEVDPFGGTAGNGPRVLPGGHWPSPLARVAMAHDTDWTLGRYFGVGPLAALRADTTNPLAELGRVGLFPVSDARYDGVGSYLRDGQPDWVVRARELSPP